MPGFDDLWFNKAQKLLDKADHLVSEALWEGGWKCTGRRLGGDQLWQGEEDGIPIVVSKVSAGILQERRDRIRYFEEFPDELKEKPAPVFDNRELAVAACGG